MRFDAKVSAIEEMRELITLKMDELHGILNAYKMRIKKGTSLKCEATFKASRRMKNKGHLSSESSGDDEEANFVRKFNKGTIKRKGKYTLKFFNYGIIGHFATKFPQVGSDSSEEEVYYDKGKGKKSHYNKKSTQRNSEK